MTTQTRINEIQAIYKEWLAVHERLEIAKQDLAKSAALMTKLEYFYFDGEYREFFEQIENGLEVDLTTDGEYSVMGEDTLWNASCEHQSLLWHNLRFAVKHLDRQMPGFYGSLDNAFDEPYALSDNEPSNPTKPSD